MAIVIDGPTLEIRLDATTFNYTADQIYSVWKQWVLDGNANWPKAIDVIGGDATGLTERAPSFYFLRNDTGWRLKKPEATIDVTVEGNFVARNALIQLTAEPTGMFNPTITFNRTSVAGVSAEAIAQAVWAFLSAGAGGLTTETILNNIRDLLRADEVYTADTATKLHEDTKVPLLEKDVVGGTAPQSDINITKKDP